MKVDTKTYQTSVGEETRVTFTNGSGAAVTLSSRGAGIVSIIVPDRDGCLADVVSGHEAVGKNAIWMVEYIRSDEVRFTAKTAAVSYRWAEDNVLEIYLSADFDESTILKPTYFNLEGRDSGSVLDEYIWLNASRYLLPSGDAAPVEGTPMDFTTAKTLGRDINNCWLINDWESGVMNEAAVLASHRSGRQLSVFTTLPRVRVETNAGKNGVAIECQDTPSRADEESTQLIFLDFSTF